MFSFYNLSLILTWILLLVSLAVTNSNKNTRKMSAKSIMLIIGICIVFLLGVIFILFCFWKRKKRIPTRTVAPPIGIPEIIFLNFIFIFCLNR